MSFLRPEAKALLLRWRETLIGARRGGARALVRADLLRRRLRPRHRPHPRRVALAVAGVQRARFRQGTDGPGIVQIVEGRVTYFGPWSGGGASLDRLAWLELVPVRGGAGAWVLIEEDGERLEIPVDARGAERLFDVFAALPGLDTRAMLAALRPPVRERTQIWQRDRPRLH